MRALAALSLSASVVALQPRGAAKDPARVRFNVGVLGFDLVGSTTYGYLQRLGYLQPSGLKQPVALLESKMQRRALSATLSSDFQGALENRRAVELSDGRGGGTADGGGGGLMQGHWSLPSRTMLADCVGGYDGAGPPYGLQRCFYGQVLTEAPPPAFEELCAAADHVSVACVGEAAADAAHALLRESCKGSLLIELAEPPAPHPSSWSHLKGFRILDGSAPTVEDVAAVLAVGACALSPETHHRLRPGAPPSKESYTSPLDIMGFLLDALPEDGKSWEEDAAPGVSKWSTW